MALYVVLNVFLFQKGSPESKPMGKEAPQDEDPREAAIKKATPWPVKRGGMALKFYEHSLSILLFMLFLAWEKGSPESKPAAEPHYETGS